MQKNLLLSLLILFFISCKSTKQLPITKTEKKVTREFFQDSTLSKISFYGTDSYLDSIKTYYKSGSLKEVFYYNDNGKYDGYCYQYGEDSKKLVTWKFNNGKLVSRKDHNLVFNKLNEQRIKNYHKSLLNINKVLKQKPNDTKLLFAQTQLRYNLGNHLLALNGALELMQGNNLNSKTHIKLHELLAGVYNSYGNTNYAIHHRIKALDLSDEKERLTYNLGSYLYTIKSYQLSEYCLNKVLESKPNHAFVHWSLARRYSDFNQYEKAMEHINIAFKNEKNVIRFSSNKAERDLRTIRGLLYHKLGDSKKGITDLRSALEVNPNNSFAMRNLGVIYSDLKQPEKACRILNKAAELGYEKKHNKNDLKYYQQLSCNNIETEKPTLPTFENQFIELSVESNSIEITDNNLLNNDYEVFNYKNELIGKNKITTNAINLSNLPSGLYSIKILNPTTPQTFQFIKNKEL